MFGVNIITMHHYDKKKKKAKSGNMNPSPLHQNKVSSRSADFSNDSFYSSDGININLPFKKGGG